MSDHASFILRTRNLDVLTCIANLSNDGVFSVSLPTGAGAIDHMIHFNSERFLGPYPSAMPKKP